MAGERVRVWDAAVRACHWALAAGVLFDLVRDEGDRVHRFVGYVACAIVGLRLLWAFFAGSPAGFADLKPSVRGAWEYTRLLLQGRAPATPGHNPLATWMVWLLWALVLLLGLTGWISRTDMFWGEDGPKVIHAWLADALLVAVCLHLAGVVGMSFLHRENLPWTMVTGRKRSR